jgi:phage-related protein
LDPSGVLAGAYSYIKKIVRMINEITVKIAKVVEIVSAVYYLIQDIQKIIDYLKSLPARFLAMVQDCITNFLGGIKNFTSQILSIPGAVGNSIESIASNLSGSADSAISTLNAAAAANPVPDALKDLFTNPNLDHASALQQHINNTYDANTVIATATSSNFDPNKVQWA